MTLKELIKLLQQVKDQDAKVYYSNGDDQVHVTELQLYFDNGGKLEIILN